MSAKTEDPGNHIESVNPISLIFRMSTKVSLNF